MAAKALWRLKQEKLRGTTRFVIVRYVKSDDGTATSERYPSHKYKQFRDNPEELQKLVLRLNYDAIKERSAKEKLAFKHSFIDDDLMEEFKALLLSQIPSRDRALTKYHYVHTHFLSFFVQKLGLANPREWYQVHQTKWADYLRTNKDIGAASTKREVVQVSNRFIKFLHSKRPDEVPLYKFEPLSKSVLSKLEATRIAKGESANRKPIRDEDWKEICKLLKDSPVGPAAHLAYNYGLRRAECLGLTPNNVRKGYLWVEKQLVSLKPEPNFGPPKGRKPREVPHWYGSPDEAYKLIKKMNEQLMHPDTLSDRWKELMIKLRLDYDFHDLRHTFVTRAIAVYKERDVQLAAGHESIETTMGYAHDHRNMDDEEFNPEAA